eukprot:1895708-Rhodomonas_salina.2
MIDDGEGEGVVELLWGIWNLYTCFSNTNTRENRCRNSTSEFTPAFVVETLRRWKRNFSHKKRCALYWFIEHTPFPGQYKSVRGIQPAISTPELKCWKGSDNQYHFEAGSRFYSHSVSSPLTQPFNASLAPVPLFIATAGYSDSYLLHSFFSSHLLFVFESFSPRQGKCYACNESHHVVQRIAGNSP